MAELVHAARVVDGIPGSPERGALYSRIEAVAGAITWFGMTQSVVFFTGTPETAAAVAALDGVERVRESTKAQEQFVTALDHLALIADAHARTSKPNGSTAVIAEAALIDGHPPYPTLRQQADGSVVWGVDPGRVVPTRICGVGALNVSIQAGRRAPYDREHPVALAMSDIAPHLTVVVAAGNVDGDPDPTMHGWVLNPDVFSVGATDPSGMTLLSGSRVGDPAAGTGPSVVACGVDESGQTGTSFAAPIVTTQFAILNAALLAVRSVVIAGSPYPEGVPLAGRCFVDMDRASVPGSHAYDVGDPRARKRAIAALPIEVVDAEAVDSSVGDDLAARMRRLPDPALLQRAVIASARAVPGFEPWQVGAGFVSDETTIAFLARLTTSDLAALHAVAPREPERLVFREGLVPAFVEGVKASMLGWFRGIADRGDGGVIFIEPRPEAVASPDGDVGAHA